MNFKLKATELVHGRQQVGAGDGAWETDSLFLCMCMYVYVHVQQFFPVQTDIIVSWSVLQHQLSCHVGRTG